MAWRPTSGGGGDLGGSFDFGAGMPGGGAGGGGLANLLSPSGPALDAFDAVGQQTPSPIQMPSPIKPGGLASAAGVKPQPITRPTPTPRPVEQRGMRNMPRRRPQQPQGNNSSLDPVKLKSNMETIKKSMPDDVQEALNDIGDLNKKGKPAPLKRTGGKLQGTAPLNVQGQPVPLRQPSVRPNIDREGLKAAAMEADRSNWKSMKIGDMKEPEGVKWFNAPSWRPQPNKPTPPQRSQTQSTQPTGQPTGVVTQPSDQQFQLGSVSEQYETGGRGAGTIGYDKYGGWSYGSYQLATKPGTLSKFLKSSDYGDQFDGLRPGTPAFNNKWKSMGDDPNFAKAQHNFIKRTHYDPAREYASKLGIPDHPAINQAIWSSSVQHGGVRKLLARAYNKVKSSFTPANFIKALYDARISYTSNNAYAPALRNRYNREKADVLSLIQ